MCNKIGQFRSLSISNGFVKGGSDITLRIASKGTVSLHYLLPADADTDIDTDNEYRSCDHCHCRYHCVSSHWYWFDLLDVLFVPTLRYYLLSWNMWWRNYEVHQSRLDLYVYDQSGGMLVFIAKYTNCFPII